MTISPQDAKPPTKDANARHLARVIWQAMELSASTPRPPDTDTAESRHAHRTVRKHRTWALIGGMITTLLALACLIAFVVDLWQARALTSVVAVFAAAAAAGFWTLLVSATSYRRLTRFGRAVLTGLWRVGTPLLFLFAVTVVILGALIGSGLLETGRTNATVFTATLMALTLELAALCSAASTPLLSTDAPRPWRAQWAQVGWTTALVSSVIATAFIVIGFRQPIVEAHQTFDVLSTTVTLTLALLTATFAWHVRARAELSRVRTALLNEITSASAALSSGDGDASSKRAQLERLQAAVRRDTFASQSPAAPPAAARAEVADFADALVAASSGSSAPSSWAARRQLPDREGGDVFRALVDAYENDRETFLAASVLVLGSLREQLLGGAAAPIPSAD